MTKRLRPHEIVTQWRANTSSPTQAQIDFFAAQWVPAWALAGAPGSGEHAVGFARVEFDKDGHFEFSAQGKPSMVVPALDENFEAADLIAWPLAGNCIASWWGSLSVLGAQHLTAPRLGDGLVVFPGPFAWLRGNREGLVIVDQARAARALIDASPIIAAGGPEHAKALEDMLTLKPKVLVPIQDRRRHAA